MRIPGGKHVVVDAKAPLAAYLDAFETSDEAERERHFADHARQVREHIGKLSAKGYWRQFDPSPDFVVMFLPDESYLRVAHEHDSSLQEYAWSSNVILASPSTLMILLRTVVDDLAAGDARGERARDLGSRPRALQAPRRRWARTSRSSDARSTVQSTPTTRRSGSLERQVLVQARRFEQHGITGIEPPELQPIERQTRPLAAAELVEPGEQQRLEAVVAGTDAA